MLTQGEFAGSIWSLGLLLLFPHSGWNWRFIFLLLILIHKKNSVSRERNQDNNNETIHTGVKTSR